MLHRERKAVRAAVWPRLERWAKKLRRDILTLWFCSRHPQTPVAAKLFAALLVAYAFSPIDLIPDFIPILGYIDDVILLPVGIYLCLRLVPQTVLADCRAKAAAWLVQRRAKPKNYFAAAVIVVIWAGLLAWLCAEFGRELL
jgi:uncharacterized membrane protein YkvA (DUF1232 family)